MVFQTLGALHMQSLSNNLVKENLSTLAIQGGQPVRDDYLVFGAPCLDEEEITEVVKTLRSGWIGQGYKTKLFEEKFAQYVGCQHAIAVSSCTAGLHICLHLADIQPGDEVITTPMTFAATGNVIFHTGARPQFVDIDPQTLNINPDLIEEKITERTRAIIPVHFGGLPCDLDRIREIAKKYNLTVIEDAAHAIGARYNGKKIGNYGSLTSFSFYANKNITTVEGGMITTDDPELADKISSYRLHGLSSDAWGRYHKKKLIVSEAIFPGFKYNLTDFQSSLGIHQIEKVERFLEVREKYAEIFDQEFKDSEYVSTQFRPTDIEQNRHALHLYLIILNPERFSTSRDEILEAIRAENIGVGIHYKALHLHPYYRQKLKYNEGDFPVSEWVSQNAITLPLTPCMSLQDVSDVLLGVTKVLKHYRK